MPSRMSSADSLARQDPAEGSAAGAAANRVALEACVKARNAGREIEKESRDILLEAAKHSPELAIALETWKEIKFEFDTVDKLDVQ